MIYFTVQSDPKRRFVGASPSPFDRFGDPAARSAPIEDITVPTFFQDDYDGYYLFQAMHSLINDVNCETGSEPESLNVGRFTFLELCAHLENRTGQRARSAPGKRVSEGRIEFLGVAVLLRPGLEHFITAVPHPSWLLSHAKPTAFTRLSPRPEVRSLRSVLPPPT